MSKNQRRRKARNRRPQSSKGRGNVDRYNNEETVFKLAESPYKRRDKYGRISHD